MNGRYCILLFLSVFSLTKAGAQDQAQDPDSDEQISNKTLIKKVNRAFGVIATGQSEAANLANYGSLEPLNGAFKLNVFGPIGTVDKQYVPFFSFSAAGKLIGEQTGGLFSDSKMNNDVSLSGKLHFPICTPKFISGDEEQDIMARYRWQRNVHRQKQFLAALASDTQYIALQLENLQARLEQNRLQSRRLVAKINAYGLKPDALKKTPEARIEVTDSLLALNRKVQELRGDSLELRQQLAELSVLLDPVSGDLLRKNKYNRQHWQDSLALEKFRDSLENTITLNAKVYSWIAPVFTVNRRKYFTFDDAAAFGTQLQKRILTTWSAGAEFNLISYSDPHKPVITGRKHHVHVANLGILYLRNNNVEDLSTTELSDSRKYTAGDSAHSLATKYNVYTDSIVEYQACRLYAHYYYYFGKTNNFAVHFFPELELRNTKQNPFGMGLGFIMAFKNKKDNTVVNVELFGRLIDMGNALQLEEQKMINRNIVGLNFGVPLHFLTN